MILLLDNYDSFVHNIAHALRAMGHGVEVVRNDEVSVEGLLDAGPSHVILSPGPGVPADAGITVPLVRAARGRVPVLGICLGHQAVGAAYGAAVAPARIPMHGRASRITHLGVGILSGIGSPFDGGRYHSLALDPATLPDSLRQVAWTEDGDLMAIWDEAASVWGLQFHPESILTPDGERILGAFATLPPPTGPTRREAGEPLAAVGP